MGEIICPSLYSNPHFPPRELRYLLTKHKSLYSPPLLLHLCHTSIARKKQNSRWMLDLKVICQTPPPPFTHQRSRPRDTHFPSREICLNTRNSKIFLQEPDSDNADYTIPISFPRPRKWGKKHESRGFPNRTPEGEDGKNPPLPHKRTFASKERFWDFPRSF